MNNFVSPITNRMTSEYIDSEFPYILKSIGMSSHLALQWLFENAKSKWTVMPHNTSEFRFSSRDDALMVKLKFGG